MSVQIKPQFNLALRLSERADLDSDEVTLRRLRDVIAGRDTSYSRTRAMTLLLLSDFPTKHRDFERILENDSELTEIRCIAALNLARVNTPAALEILLRNGRLPNGQILACVMTALGRIGDESALEVISDAKKCDLEFAASQARFAESLICHRLGFDAGELPLPDSGMYLDLPAGAARAFRVEQATDADAELCLRSLSYEPFGVEFSEQDVYTFRCDRTTWMILFNRECVTRKGITRLIERKAFLGLVASAGERGRPYSVNYVVLTSPSPESKTVSIFGHRPKGESALGGVAYVDGHQAAFTLRAISRRGGHPLLLEGILEEHRLTIKTAFAGMFVQGQRRLASKTTPQEFPKSRTPDRRPTQRD